MRLDVFGVLELDSKIFNNNELYTECLFKTREIAAKYNIATNFGANMCGLHKNYTFKFNNYFENPLFFEIVDNPLSFSAERFFNTSNIEKFKENLNRTQFFISEILNFSSKLFLIINSYEQKDFDKLNSTRIDIKNFAKELVSLANKKDSLYPTLKITVTKGKK